MNELNKVPVEFFANENVVFLARSLVGKYLYHSINGQVTGGKIVETEAYNGRNDRACHAFGKQTERTRVMYKQGGVAYVYLCYGIHRLFNIVTNREGIADAVLIRALEPTEGLDVMRKRTGKKDRMTSGPGLVGKAMGFETTQSGEPVNGNRIWLSHDADRREEVEAVKRIGIDYAGRDANLPWRFKLAGNDWVSGK